MEKGDNKKKQEIINATVDAELVEFHVVTLQDTDEIYYFKEGIYVLGFEKEIQFKLQEALGDDLNNHDVQEALGRIRRKTYKARTALNDPISKVCCENGVIDLLNLSLDLHSPEYHFFTKIPVKYEPTATCQLFEEFIKEILEDDKKVLLIQEWFGYCLYREYPFQSAAMFIGGGSNGKSVLLGVLRAMLGWQNVSTVSLQELTMNRFAKADLYQKFANIYPDIPADALKSTGEFKTITGGDLLRAERKYAQPFQFVNFAKLLFSANKLPESYDDTDAFHRRWHIIPFNKQFLAGAAKKNLLRELTVSDTLSGILNWALAGLKRLLEQQDFSAGSAIDDRRRLYARLSSPIKAFVLDCLEFSVDYQETVPKQDIYAHYVKYCRDSHLFIYGNVKFWAEMKKEFPPFVREVAPKVNGRQVQSIQAVKLVGVVGLVGGLTYPEPTVDSYIDIEVDNKWVEGSQNPPSLPPVPPSQNRVLTPSPPISISVSEQVRQDLASAPRITNDWLANCVRQAFGPFAKGECRTEDLLHILEINGMSRIQGEAYLKDRAEAGVWFEVRAGYWRLT